MAGGDAARRGDAARGGARALARGRPRGSGRTSASRPMRRAPRGAAADGDRGALRRRAGARRSRELVPELEAVIAREPLREHLREQLMLALYRSGRQAEALRAYDDARRTLVDELGIEPGSALRGLHQRMLEQDPALDLGPGATPARVTPPRARSRRRLALLVALPGVPRRRRVLVLAVDGGDNAGPVTANSMVAISSTSGRVRTGAARRRRSHRAWRWVRAPSGRSTRTTRRSPGSIPRPTPCAPSAPAAFPWTSQPATGRCGSATAPAPARSSWDRWRRASRASTRTRRRCSPPSLSPARRGACRTRAATTSA